jgi:hypothetical protein
MGELEDLVMDLVLDPLERTVQRIAELREVAAHGHRSREDLLRTLANVAYETAELAGANANALIHLARALDRRRE